jgi:hypothetical protein
MKQYRANMWHTRSVFYASIIIITRYLLYFWHIRPISSINFFFNEDFIFSYTRLCGKKVKTCITVQHQSLKICFWNACLMWFQLQGLLRFPKYFPCYCWQPYQTREKIEEEAKLGTKVIFEVLYVILIQDYWYQRHKKHGAITTPELVISLTQRNQELLYL